MSERDSGPGRDDAGREPEPVNEEEAWAAIVAAYGEEPADPPGVRPHGPDRPRNGAAAEGPADASAGRGRGADEGDRADGADGAEDDGAEDDGGGRKNTGNGPLWSPRPLGSSVIVPAGIGPRDWTAPEPSEDDFDDTDEGHFVPPDPPPLPRGDATATFAWLAVLGGPLLLVLTVLLGWHMTWWIATLGLGGFLGGFATLVARMKDDGDDADDDPDRGAVV